MFNFSDEKNLRSDFWIFKPLESYTLRGWHRKGREFDTFLVNEYSKDKSGRVAWAIPGRRRGRSASSSSPPSNRQTCHRRRGEATNHRDLRGPRTVFDNKTISRVIGEFQAIVTIRYDRVFLALPRDTTGD